MLLSLRWASATEPKGTGIARSFCLPTQIAGCSMLKSHFKFSHYPCLSSNPRHAPLENSSLPRLLFLCSCAISQPLGLLNRLENTLQLVTFPHVRLPLSPTMPKYGDLTLHAILEVLRFGLDLRGYLRSLLRSGQSFISALDPARSRWHLKP
jgi:hypothetical protein